MGESSFLSQFLMITDLKTVIFIAVLIGTFFIVKQFLDADAVFAVEFLPGSHCGDIEMTGGLIYKPWSKP